MTTDITELAPAMKAAAVRAQVAIEVYASHRISSTALMLEIEEFESLANKPTNVLALVEALEKAQQTINEMDDRIRKQNRHVCELFDDGKALRERVAELESRTVTVKLPDNTPLADAPEQIWLQTDGVWPSDGEFSELTWCTDRQHDDDTLYVRADLLAGIKVEAE